MGWFEQLKMIPSDKSTLSFVIVNAAATEKAVQEIKELKVEPDDLKNILRQVDAGTIDLQKIKDLYGQPPYGDQTLEQMKENVQKLKDAASFMTISDVRTLLDEAYQAKKDSNQAKVDEILENIDQNANLGAKTLQRNRDIRDLLDILREKSGQSVIMFENPPSNEQLLADFAEAIGGELKEGSILTDLKSESELIALMVPKRSKKTKQIVDDAPTLQRKEAVKKTYNKIMRNDDGSKTNVKMLFNSGDESVEIDDIVRQKKIFVASKQKLTLVEPFNGASVIKYIKAVDKIKGSVRAFRPKKVPKGADFPDIIFLDKSSNNSLNVNSFAKIILTNVFDTNWSKPFFDAVRVQESMSDKQAFETIIDEIYTALIDGEQTTAMGLSVRPFRVITELGSKTRKKITAEIRNIIKDSNRLEDNIEEKTQERRMEQLSFLEGNFTIREASTYVKYLEDIGYDEVKTDKPEEVDDFEYAINYFKDGVSTKDQRELKDKEGRTQRDELGQKLFNEISGKENANYAVIIVDGKLATPETAYSEGVKAKTSGMTPKLREMTETKLANLNKKLLSARQKGKQLQPDKAESISRSKEKIKNLERDIEEAKRKLKEGTEEVDISAQTETLRQELMNMSDFSQFILKEAKRLKDKGGLIALENENPRATALESLTPQQSLSFFLQVDELVGEEKVRKAFKTIDANPDSQEAVKVAKQLNDEMPKIIENMQDEIVGGFKLRLQDFAQNPASFPDNQVILAKKQFVEKYGLLRAGEE
tara:strand:+ start:712 stop:3000 length:2289 start_codon:yes stop_codon:yes gene_type:complete